MSDESVAALRERDDEISRLRALVEAMETTAAASDVEQRIATAVAEAEAALQASVDDLQTKYDAVVVESATHKQSYEGLVAEIEKAKEDAETAAAKAEIEKARLAAVEPFKDALGEKYVTENASRWASMDDDSFQVLVEGWRAALGDRAPVGDKLPAATAMVATGDWTQKPGGRASTSLLRDLNDAAARGVDLKRI